jgi:hypothetical protein
MGIHPLVDLAAEFGPKIVWIAKGARTVAVAAHDAYKEGLEIKRHTQLQAQDVYDELSRFRSHEMQLWRKAKTSEDAARTMIARIQAYDVARLRALATMPPFSHTRNAHPAVRRLIRNIEAVQARINDHPDGMTPATFKRSYRFNLGRLFGDCMKEIHAEINSKKFPILYLY